MPESDVVAKCLQVARLLAVAPWQQQERKRQHRPGTIASSQHTCVCVATDSPQALPGPLSAESRSAHGHGRRGAPWGAVGPPPGTQRSPAHGLWASQRHGAGGAALRFACAERLERRSAGSIPGQGHRPDPRSWSGPFRGRLGDVSLSPSLLPPFHYVSVTGEVTVRRDRDGCAAVYFGDAANVAGLV